MGRWTQYDEDDYRLPEGMKRIGYDADSGRYYFRDSGGLVYKGPEGSEFGQLTLEVDKDSDGYRILALYENGTRHNPRGGNYRTLFPFFLIPASSVANTVRSSKQRLGWDRASARFRRWRESSCRWVREKTRHAV